LIAPLFDDFGPMRDKALEGKILELAERIEFANSYRPWATGEPLTYADKFRAP
jgi:hypothetical protein